MTDEQMRMGDSHEVHHGQTQRLVTLDPPKPPTDIVQSALFLPLSSIATEHEGRKIRTIGQILAFEPKSGILLLSAIPDRAVGALHTMLVDISTHLLGQTPAMAETSPAESMLFTRSPVSQTATRKDGLLKLESGECVSVVGWLEGDGTKLAARVSAGHAYLRPIPIVLEAIHIANARIPPQGALYRGSVDTFGVALSVDQA